MKKWMAALVALCLTVQSWTAVPISVQGAQQPLQAEQQSETEMETQAEDEETRSTETELETEAAVQPLPETQEEAQDEAEPETQVPGSAQEESGPSLAERASDNLQSVLEVEVRSSLLSPCQGKVTVEITDAGGAAIGKKELEIAGGGVGKAMFEVVPGAYRVCVRAEKFADYTQQIVAQAGWKSKIVVSTSKMETGKSVTAGWMRPGDVTGDGVIDQKDIDALLAAVRNQPQNTSFDLNGDGKVNLLDLQYAVQSKGESCESLVEQLGLVQQANAAEGTAVEGNLDAFLNQGEPIALRPSQTNAPISEENSVGMEFVLAEEDSRAPEIQGIVLHAPSDSDEDGVVESEITKGTVSVAYIEDGQEKEETIPLGEAAASLALHASGSVRAGDEPLASKASVSTESNGSLVLNFGKQIAVKRVILVITGTKKTEPLVNIAKVEFVNDMEKRIPAPKLDIPTLNAPVEGDKNITVSWNAQQNVTGYEIYVSGPVKNQSENEEQIVRVSGTQHIISSINDKSLKNFAVYTIKVRSVNGDWNSPWSEARTATPKPQKKPASPDNVSAQGGYRSVTVSWKDMDDSEGYMVYYKKESEKQYHPVVDGFELTPDGAGRLSGTRYIIGNLEDDTKYLVYVVGWNELGWGSNSLESVATTKSIVPPQLPKYELLNTSNGVGVLTSHIVDATYGGSGGAKMVGGTLDTEPNSALGLVDDDYGSYWVKEDWDDGVSYPADSKGMKITLDGDYQMNYFTFAAADAKGALNNVSISYWSEGNAQKQSVGARLYGKTDEKKNVYYIVKFDRTITANKLHICLGSSSRMMMVGEIHFHKYNSLEDDVMGLYEDEMHTTLRADVTEETIAALEARLDTADPVSGEKHPLFQELTLELNTAREILASSLDPSFEVDQEITAKKDGGLGFGGLNAWQPLGRVAASGERILVYVGHNTKRTGDAAELQLVVTQHHAESSALARSVALKVGRNEITIPQVSSINFERGGQLYVAYTGNNASDRYAVRVSGGSKVPSLIVNGLDESERNQAIAKYVSELESYVGGIEQTHASKHDGESNVDYAFDTRNCILNATDMMMDEMMYSVPATQVWDAIKGAQDKVEKLDLALKAMEKTMTLFYQHKGLSDDAGTVRGKNALPTQHLNIRYMRMFAGAFMYAAGNHIGIEWPETALAAAPNDWSGFGWGIAHEIGHDINQGAYAVAEVTNNYFAQLLTGKTRYTYKNVYAKVTSGTTGRATNVFTQLALYWQLHLAFDDNKDDRHIYDNYEDQFANLFFARVDTYARNADKAPQEGLKLDGGSDQNLMRLACAAANKNILPFFRRWGMTPDSATVEYAAKYGEEDTKALYYINDEARDYRVDHPDESGTIKGQDVVTASAAANANQVEIAISTDQDAELILGYEVSRSMVSNGEKQTQVVGFVPISTAESTLFVDTVSTINNRVMSYEVRAVDKFLNYSNATDAGSTKIQTDGVRNKELWTVETTMTSEDDVAVDPDNEDPDSGYDEQNPGSVEGKTLHTIDRVIDNDRTEEGTYHGVSTDAATITFDLHKSEELTALKYQGSALSALTVEVSQDGGTWTKVKENVAVSGGAEQTVWFDSVNEEERDSWIGTYDARYVRLTIAQSGNLSIQEIELCGPSGDNLEFMETSDGKPAIGRLTADFSYGEENADVIPKGSLIFTGTYKGNPAYNVVVLYDTDGNVVGAKDGKVVAGQVILAEVPEKGNLGETSSGTWVYYVEPGQWDEETLKKIKGVRAELYRVDNALTLEGERIVSDTQVISIPDVLPEISITDGR